MKEGTRIENKVRGLTWSRSLWVRDIKNQKGQPASDLNEFEAVPVLNAENWQEASLSHASMAAEIARLRELLQRIATGATDPKLTPGWRLKQVLHVIPCEFFPGVSKEEVSRG